MNDSPRTIDLSNWERACALILLATLPFVITPDTEDSFILGKVVWLTVVSCFWFALIVWRSGATWGRSCELDWPIAAVLGVYGLSMLIHFESANQLRHFITVLAFAGLFYAYRRYWSIGGSTRAVAWILAATASALAVYGILQDYGIDFFQYSGGVRDWRAKVIATLGNPNFLGGYLSYCIPVIAALGLRKNAPLIDVAGSAVALTLAFACLALTFCVGATLGLLALIAVVPLTLWSVRPAMGLSLAKTALFISLAAGGAGWYLLDNPYNSHSGSLYAEAKASPQWTSGVGARRFNWLTTKLMMQERPLTGIGFKNYLAVHIHYQGLNYQRYGNPHDRNYVVPVDQPHFQLMESAAEAGPLGALAVSWLAAAWVVASMRRLKRCGNDGWFAWGAYAGVWVVLVHSMSSFPFHLPASALVCVVLASFTVSRADARSAAPPGWMRYGAIALATVTALYSFTPLIAERSLRLGRASFGLTSISHLETARAWNPFNHQTFFLLGVRYDQQGWSDSAIRALNRALELQESHAVHSYLAGLHYREGNLDAAIASQRRVVELNPVYPGHYRDLAEMLRQRGDDAEAQAMIEKAEELEATLDG